MVEGIVFLHVIFVALRQLLRTAAADLRLLDEQGELARRPGGGGFGQDLAVEIDASQLEAVDQRPL